MAFVGRRARCYSNVDTTTQYRLPAVLIHSHTAVLRSAVTRQSLAALHHQNNDNNNLPLATLPVYRQMSSCFFLCNDIDMTRGQRRPPSGQPSGISIRAGVITRPSNRVMVSGCESCVRHRGLQHMGAGCLPVTVRQSDTLTGNDPKHERVWCPAAGGKRVFPTCTRLGRERRLADLGLSGRPGGTPPEGFARRW